MANNLIQIKRSLNTANPTSLANGELAFSANGDVLFIGSNSAIIPIGGKRNPGVLSANQALVANSTSGIDKIIVANAVPTSIWANSSSGASGQYLSSNGSGGIYWATPAAGVAGSNSQVQFNANGVLSGDSGFTFDGVTDTLTVGQGVITNTTSSTNTTTGALTVAGGLGVAGRINTGDLAAGNDSVYSSLTGTTLTTNTVLAAGKVNSAILSVGSWVVANQSGVFTSGVVNGDIVSVGTAFKANTSQVTIGAGIGLSANGSLGSAGQVLASNGTSIYWTTDTGDISSVVAGNGLTGGGTSGDVTLDVGSGNGISVGTDAISVTAANGISVDTSGVNVKAGTNGGLSVNTTGVWVSAASGLTTNSTGLHVVAGNTQVVSNTSGVFIDQTKIDHNSLSNYDANKHVDHSTLYVLGGNGLSGDGALTGNVTLAVGSGYGITTNADFVAVNANNGLVANADGLFVKAGTGVTVNATGVHIGQSVGTTDNVTFANVVTTDLTVNGNTTLGDATSDKLTLNAKVAGDLMPTANVTYNVGNNTLRWNEGHFANIHSVSGYFDGSVQITGNLTVTGNVVTTNVSSVVISDPLIYLAGNNYVSDLVDIGFVANYNDGTNRHTGLFRDATDGVYKLFSNLTQELDSVTVVNTADPTFAIATLNAYLTSGGLTTNTTAVTITANSTYAVDITANTLSLSTALAATSGGTGYKTFTAGDILTASNTSYLSKLSLGSSGYVLQSNGTALVYDTLDGGTF